MLNKTLFSAVAAAVLFTGCATGTPDQTDMRLNDLTLSRDPFLQSVQVSTDKLLAQMKNYSHSTPVVVTSAQNNDQLNRVCPQGRVMSEIVSSRLTEKNIPVTEVRLTNLMRINPEGEMILSRELRELAQSVKADTVVAATWSTLSDSVVVPVALNYGYGSGATVARAVPGVTYVTLKAVRLSDGLVLASDTFAAPKNWGSGNCLR